eukprot:TRINITY_DN13_c0_g1_i5.p1 TRINITY_DN13_c0_g1~~TRINITY_DN13_c0_g1_i5.p1  ORF type:complete len:405 (-),score=164.36 TRINITY_DN13_c0_g1_i5:108-1322(-)
MRVLVFLALLGVCLAQTRLLGTFNVPHPSFLDVTPFSAGGPLNLVITSFDGNPFAGGSVFNIRDIATQLQNISNIEVSTITSSLAWPNEVYAIPKTIFGADNYLLVADGFLVPGKSTGNVYVIPVISGTPIGLAKPKSGWFYHRAKWVDMNGDGRLDVLTARATKPFFGSGKGELVWLEQPANDPLHSVPWTEHVVQQGPDVMFCIGELDNDTSTLELVATQFFGQKLTLSVLSLTDGSLLSTRVIDDTIGAAYNVALEDLNNDGKAELLVTNHMGDRTKAAMYAYEVPADLKNGAFTRHTLYSGFVNVQSGPGAAAPGFAYAFRPQPSNMSSLPWIAVAGDGAEQAYLFAPTGTPFSYTMSVLENSQGTVGALEIFDVNGDGYSEIFVPNYDAGHVSVYTFAP